MKTFNFSEIIKDPEGNPIITRDPNEAEKVIKIIENWINTTPPDLNSADVENSSKIASSAIRTRNEIVALLERAVEWTFAKVLYINYAKNNQSKDYDEIMLADRLCVDLLTKSESVEMSDKEIKLLKERVISLDVASFIKAKIIRLLES